MGFSRLLCSCPFFAQLRNRSLTTYPTYHSFEFCPFVYVRIQYKIDAICFPTEFVSETVFWNILNISVYMIDFKSTNLGPPVLPCSPLRLFKSKTEGASSLNFVKFLFLPILHGTQPENFCAVLKVLLLKVCQSIFDDEIPAQFNASVDESLSDVVDVITDDLHECAKEIHIFESRPFLVLQKDTLYGITCLLHRARLERIEVPHDVKSLRDDVLVLSAQRLQ